LVRISCQDALFFGQVNQKPVTPDAVGDDSVAVNHDRAADELI
jgi:hypothetical protein